MNIAIAANIDNVNSFFDEHFGRCNWFCLYNSETGKTTFIANPAKDLMQKAGCQAAEYLISQHINVIVAGRFGSKVVDLFRKNNVQVVIPESQRTLQDIINQIK